MADLGSVLSDPLAGLVCVPARSFSDLGARNPRPVHAAVPAAAWQPPVVNHRTGGPKSRALRPRVRYRARRGSIFLIAAKGCSTNPRIPATMRLIRFRTGVSWPCPRTRRWHSPAIRPPPATVSPLLALLRQPLSANTARLSFFRQRIKVRVFRHLRRICRHSR